MACSYRPVRLLNARITGVQRAFISTDWPCGLRKWREIIYISQSFPLAKRFSVDEYYKMASHYFDTFEGRRFLPSWKHWHWYACTLALATFLYAIYRYFFTPPDKSPSIWLLLGSEILFLLCCGAIALYHFKASVRANSQDNGLRPLARWRQAKRKQLEVLTGRPASSFKALVDEIMQLHALEQMHRPSSDRGWGHAWKMVYDRDSKARIWLVITGVLGFCAGLLGKAEPNSLLDFVAEHQKIIISIGVLVLLYFCLWITSVFLGAQLLESIFHFFVSLFPHIENNQTALKYLVRDLIRLHVPSPQQAPSPHRALRPTRPAMVRPRTRVRSRLRIHR